MIGDFMNEFVAKKLGEVHAFSVIGLEGAERGGDAFIEAIGADNASGFTGKLSEFKTAVEAAGNDLTTAKSEKTTAKLRGMMEAYIGDDWDNPVELLEWLSFFTGSAAAHWSLVCGAANTIGHEGMQATAPAARDFYAARLQGVIDALEAVGAKRAA